MSERVILLGGTSGIARGIASALAERGDAIVLAARDTAEAERNAADLRARHGAEVSVVPFDALDYDGHQAFLEGLAPFDGVVLAFGAMSEQAEAQADFALARRMIEVNYVAAVSLLERAAALLEARGGGYLAALSSVAGDRGRPSNYLYGSTKAALTAYLSGLRSRLAKRGVRVITVKPGFVYTAMTRDVLKPDSPLVANPAQVGRDVARAIARGASTVYTPWFWRWIMLVIRAIPELIFKRLSL